jgi:hypothetical protein
MPSIKEVQITMTVTYEDGNVAHIHSPPYIKNNRGCAVFTNKDVILAMRAAFYSIVSAFASLKTKGIYEKIKQQQASLLDPPFSLN